MSHSQVADTAEAPASQPPQEAEALELSPEILARMSPELRSTVPTSAEEETAPPEDDAEDEPEEEEDLPEEDSDDEPADEEDEEPSPDEEVAAWLPQLDENVNIASRIPKKQLGPVLAAWFQRHVDIANNAVRQAAQVVEQRVRERVEMEQKVKEIDGLLEDGDVHAMREKLAQFPGGERNYHLVRAQLQPVQANSPEHYQQRAAQLVAQLASNPSAAQELQANWNYAANEADMTRLALDVGRLLQKHSGKQDTATQDLQRRKAAQERRRATPRPPDVSDGVGNSTRITMADLKRVSQEQVAAWMADPVKSKEVEAALAGTR